MMKYIRTSNNGRLFSFDVSESAPQFDASGFKKIPIFMSFENVGENDQKLIEGATLHYFKKPSGDVSCLVDRFDCYPASSDSSWNYGEIANDWTPDQEYHEEPEEEEEVEENERDFEAEFYRRFPEILERKLDQLEEQSRIFSTFQKP